MAIYLTRNPLFGQEDNAQAPVAPQFEFYEKTYTSGTTQEWILIPDRNGVSVTLTPSASTASIEVTDSPPYVVLNSTPAATTWPQGIVAAGTTAFLQGFTAFRVNIATGASVKLSAAV